MKCRNTKTYDKRGMVMNKSQPDLVEVVAEGGCLLLLEFETGELRRLDVSSFLERGGAYERLRDDEYLKLVRIIDGGMALGWPPPKGRWVLLSHSQQP